MSSALFKDLNGKDNSVATLTDLRNSITAQKKIDTRCKKLTDQNIVTAKTKAFDDCPFIL